MRPRILLNLTVFAALAAVLLSWAALTLLPIRFGEPFIRVEAEFASSPGLRTGFEVDYLGVRVGSIEEVRLRPGLVAVTLHLDTVPELPGDVTARVLRKSAVGEPYIELTPPPADTGAAPLRDGGVIPVGRTEATVEYQRLFDGAGRMLRAVDPADLTTLTHELAVGLDGRGQDLRDALADLHRLTRTVADDAGALDALAVQLTTLAGTLAGEGPRLAAGMDDLAAFTSTLRTALPELDSTLTRAPGFLDQMNALLTEARPGLRCVLTAMGTPGAPVFTPGNSRAVQHALDNLVNVYPGFVDDVLSHRPEGLYVRAYPVISLAGPVPNAEEYPRSKQDAKIPPLYKCRDAPAAKAPADGGTASPTGAPDEAARPAGTGPDQVFETVEPGARDAAAEPPSGIGPRWILMAAAGLVLLGTAAHTVRQLFRTGPRRTP